MILTTSQPFESTSANLLDTTVNPDPTTMALTTAGPITPGGKSVALVLLSTHFQAVMTYMLIVSGVDYFRSRCLSQFVHRRYEWKFLRNFDALKRMRFPLSKARFM